MTDDQHTDDLPSKVRILTDGGGPVTKQATVHAKAVVTREVDGDEVEMLRVPISSTRPDREGDRFSKEALDGMVEQIREQQPNVFLNHGLAGDWRSGIPYDVERAKIGAQMDAEVEQADDGEHDLYAYVNPDGTHDYGAKLIPKVRDEKQPEKFSVGFGIDGYDARAEVEDGYEGDGRVFNSVDEMETSNVGIPANPDASAQQAVAKSGMSQLPGFQMHPVFRAMFGMNSETVAAKTATDGGEPENLLSELRAIRSDVESLSAEVEELREEDDDEDEDDEEESSVDLESLGFDSEEEFEQFRAELDDVSKSIEERGESETKDTDTTEEPDLTNNEGGPDADKETEPEQANSADSWLDN